MARTGVTAAPGRMLADGAMGARLSTLVKAAWLQLRAVSLFLARMMHARSGCAPLGIRHMKIFGTCRPG